VKAYCGDGYAPARGLLWMMMSTHTNITNTDYFNKDNLLARKVAEITTKPIVKYSVNGQLLTNSMVIDICWLNNTLTK